MCTTCGVRSRKKMVGEESKSPTPLSYFTIQLEIFILGSLDAWRHAGVRATSSCTKKLILKMILIKRNSIIFLKIKLHLNPNFFA